MSDNWPEFLTVKETAAYLRISIHTVYRLIKHGKLPAFRVASDWRIIKSQLFPDKNEGG